jgi:hypothetical protein
MAVILNASTSSGFVQSADTSGLINLQSNGTTVLALTSTGTTITGTESISGNLSFNSGYGSAAIAYGCRAWVNFNGTGTVAIRASGNVSSITDNGTGTYTVNFTNAMPDTNYTFLAEAGNGGTLQSAGTSFTGAAPTTTSARIMVDNGGGAQVDREYVMVAIFR